MLRPLLVVGLLASLASFASAQPQTILNTPKNGVIPNLVQVQVPAAYCGAVSESHRRLVFGHDKSLGSKDLTIFKLDDTGKPDVYGTSWSLPKPPSLAKVQNYPLSVTFHPKLPLLYVWQDLNLPYVLATLQLQPDVSGFDHLAIYRIDKDEPELVTTLCRGKDLMWGSHGGALAVDPGCEFLYIPNLRDSKYLGSGRFARYPLDADGIPNLPEVDAKLPLVERLRKLEEQNAKDWGTPRERTPVEYINIFPFNAFGAGHSFIPLNKDVVIAGGVNGLITWRFDDNQVVLQALPLKSIANTLITAHPSLPAIYATRVSSDSIYRVDHVEGYLSLMPRQYTIPDMRLHSYPVVLAKQKKLLVAGQHFIFSMDLDDRGQILPDVVQTQVLAPKAHVLLHGEKSDRVYVAVEVSK